jgi:hypothetical protein
MKFRIILMCIFFSILITSSIYAQEIYYWKDEKGGLHITTSPPPVNVEKYKKKSYQKDTKEENEQYQRQAEKKKS